MEEEEGISAGTSKPKVSPSSPAPSHPHPIQYPRSNHSHSQVENLNRLVMTIIPSPQVVGKKKAESGYKSRRKTITTLGTDVDLFQGSPEVEQEQEVGLVSNALAHPSGHYIVGVY